MQMDFLHALRVKRKQIAVSCAANYRWHFEDEITTCSPHETRTSLIILAI